MKIALAFCLPAVIWAIAIILGITQAIISRTHRSVNKTRLKNDMREVEANLNMWDLIEFCKEVYITSSDDFPLINICVKLGVDPDEARVGLGRVKGGGSTWVGWGSSRAVGTAMGLNIISGIGAAANNSKLNRGLKGIENCIFYNNIAMYFNDNIISK